MAVPIGGRLSAAFRETYEQAGITQATIADHLQAHGWPTVDQPKVSKWVRGMERIPMGSAYSDGMSTADDDDRGSRSRRPWCSS
jgi:hypothetical protein